MTAPASGDKAAKTRGELLTGPVFPMVVKFGVPTMVSMLTPAIYNLTGAYFVSTLGTTAVAALGIVFSLHMILAAVGIMTGQGCASQTSRLLGAGEYEAAGFIAGTGILLCVAIGVLGLLFDEPLLRVLGATPTIMPDAVRYAEVLLIGSPVVCASFTFNNLLRSEGLAVVGMRALLAGGILNLALTPAFILGLGFGIEGAAWAAVLSQAAGLLILVNHYRRKAGLLRIIPPTLERLRRLSPTILRNGMPSLLRNALAAVAASILNLTAGGFGDAAVAVQRVGSQIESISWMTADGFAAAINSFIGQNYGGRQYRRVKKGYMTAIGVMFVWGLFCSGVLIGFPRQIFGLFIHEADIIPMGISYLVVLGFSQMFMCVELTTVGALSGLGKTLLCSVISVVFTSARIPLAMILSSTPLALDGIWWAFTISSVIKGILFFICFLYVSGKLPEDGAQASW